MKYLYYSAIGGLIGGAVGILYTTILYTYYFIIPAKDFTQFFSAIKLYGPINILYLIIVGIITSFIYALFEKTKWIVPMKLLTATFITYVVLGFYHGIYGLWTFGSAEYNYQDIMMDIYRKHLSFIFIIITIFISLVWTIKNKNSKKLTNHS